MAGFSKYTPSLESPENLQKFLVGRESLVKRLLQAIEEAGGRKSVPHFLLIGPRGIGKTHLLLLLYHTVKGAISWSGAFQNLSKLWEPILFSEEQYGVGSLTDLLLEVLARLKEQASDEKLERLLTHLKDVRVPGEAEREAILEYLGKRRNETGKRFLLLLDNLQMILSSFSEEDQSRLRSLLMSHDLFMIIGSAPTLFAAVLDYKAPFYNFFEIVRLQEISKDDDVEALLKKHLEHDRRTDILGRFDEYRPRIRAIVHLTGGNPRLILSLYQIFTQGEIVEVERALLRLLDELTPYFQDRMNQLSEQQRKVIEAMALADGPSTPTEIAQLAHLDVDVVTAQLQRLKKQGYVRSYYKEKGRRETLYDISEQLFRLWRQMRVEAGRRRLGFIVSFLKIWFTEEEIAEIIKKIVDDMVSRLEQAEYERAREIIDKLSYYQEVAPAGLQPLIHYQRVFGLMGVGDLAEAERELQERESHSEEDKELLAFTWYNLGVAYSKKGEYDRAIEAFTQALKTVGEKWYLRCLYLVNKSRVSFLLNKKAEALKDAEEAHCLATQHQYSKAVPDTALWLLMLQLDLSQEQVHQGNETKALEHYQKALGYLAQGAFPEQAQDMLIAYFKELLFTKALGLAEKALNLLEAQGHEWVELMRPYRAALDYLRTKDKAILNRLFPEIRQIVEEMVAQVEGKQIEETR